MISLARTAFYGKPAQTVAVLRAFQLTASQVFVIFRWNGDLYGDIFTASGAEIDTITGEVAPAEDEYISMSITSGATANDPMDVTAAAIATGETDA